MVEILKAPAIDTVSVRKMLPGGVTVAPDVVDVDVIDSMPTCSPDEDVEARVVEEVAHRLDTLRAETESQAREAGYQAGFDAGRIAGAEAGRLAGEQAWAEAVERAAGAIDAMSGAIATEFSEAQQIGMRIAYEVVARMLGEQFANPRAIAAFVAQIAKSLRMDEVRAICLNPEDLSLMESAGLTQGLSAGGLVRLVAAADLKPGGCRVETRRERIDANLGTQLELLDHAIAAARQRAREASA